MTQETKRDYMLEMAIDAAKQYRTSSIKEIATSAQSFADILGMFPEEDPLSPEASEALRIFQKVSHYLDLLIDLQNGKLHNN